MPMKENSLLVDIRYNHKQCSKPAGELKLASFGRSMPAHGASMSQGGGLRQEKAS